MKDGQETLLDDLLELGIGGRDAGTGEGLFMAIEQERLKGSGMEELTRPFVPGHGHLDVDSVGEIARVDNRPHGIVSGCEGDAAARLRHAQCHTHGHIIEAVVRVAAARHVLVTEIAGDSQVLDLGPVGRITIQGTAGLRGQRAVA